MEKDDIKVNTNQRFVVRMNFVFESLTEKQRMAIIDRLTMLLDEEFTTAWMMTSSIEPKA